MNVLRDFLPNDNDYIGFCLIYYFCFSLTAFDIYIAFFINLFIVAFFINLFNVFNN